MLRCWNIEYWVQLDEDKYFGNKYFCHVLSKIAAATVDTLVCLLLIVRDGEII